MTQTEFVTKWGPLSRHDYSLTTRLNKTIEMDADLDAMLEEERERAAQVCRTTRNSNHSLAESRYSIQDAFNEGCDHCAAALRRGR